MGLFDLLNGIAGARSQDRIDAVEPPSQNPSMEIDDKALAAAASTAGFKLPVSDLSSPVRLPDQLPSQPVISGQPHTQETGFNNVVDSTTSEAQPVVSAPTAFTTEPHFVGSVVSEETNPSPIEPPIATAVPDMPTVSSNGPQHSDLGEEGQTDSSADTTVQPDMPRDALTSIPPTNATQEEPATDVAKKFGDLQSQFVGIPIIPEATAPESGSTVADNVLPQNDLTPSVPSPTEETAVIPGEISTADLKPTAVEKLPEQVVSSAPEELSPEELEEAIRGIMADAAKKVTVILRDPRRIPEENLEKQNLLRKSYL